LIGAFSVTTEAAMKDQQALDSWTFFSIVCIAYRLTGTPKGVLIEENYQSIIIKLSSKRV
jgi:hypothetical protein